MEMITLADKRVFHEFTKGLSEDPVHAEVALKVFYNLVKNVMPGRNEPLIHKIKVENEPLSESERQEYLDYLTEVILDIASEDRAEVRTYTTGQVATFFGVSITTVNNWIKAGRLLGVERAAKNKQVRIPEHATWVSVSGNRIPLSDVVKTYEENERLQHQSQTADDDEAERLEWLRTSILFYEQKYGGTYDTAVAKKGDPDDPALQETNDWQWIRDAREWRYLLGEINTYDK